MHMIISAPHLLIAADIKCQTYFFKVELKDGFHFSDGGKLHHFCQVLLS